MLAPLLAALFISQAAIAGSDPCKGIKLKQDQFTQQQTGSVDGLLKNLSFVMPAIILPAYEIDFSGGQVLVKLRLPLQGVHSETLPAGFKASWLLEDRSIVELATTQETASTPIAAGAYVYTNWNTIFPVDKATVTRLGAQAVTAIRVSLPGGDETYEIKKGLANDISRAFVCFGSLLP